MPALIGAIAFPLLCLTGWMMTRFPRPTAADIAARTERVTLNGSERRNLFLRFMPILTLLFVANLLITVMRDIKEDFIVCIIDVSTISAWTFAHVDTIATLVMLAIFALLATVKNHTAALYALLALSTLGMGALAFIGANSDTLGISTTTWLFAQSLCIDVAYLGFQTIFFERFIACFKIRGNVGFFIITIDFVGYAGTVALLIFKEYLLTGIDWSVFYDYINLYVGLACCIAFVGSMAYIARRKTRRTAATESKTDNDLILTPSANSAL